MKRMFSFELACSARRALAWVGFGLVAAGLGGCVGWRGAVAPPGFGPGRTFTRVSSFVGNRLVTTRDGEACLWDVPSGQQLRRFPGHPSAAQGWSLAGAALSPDGSKLFTLAGSGGVLEIVFFEHWMVRVWDVATGEELRRFSKENTSSGQVLAQFSPDAKQLLMVVGEQLVLLDIASGRQVFAVPARCLQDFRGDCTVSFSPDGRRIVEVAGGVALLRSVTNGEPALSIPCPDGVFVSGRFSPDGKHLLTVSSTGTARTWDVQSGRLVQVFVAPRGIVNDAFFVGGGRRVLTAPQERDDSRGIAGLAGSGDMTARLWDSATGREIRQFKLPAGTYFPRMILSGDGKRLILEGGLFDKRVGRRENYANYATLWDVETGREITRLNLSGGNAYMLGFSQTDERFMLVTYAGKDMGKPAALWDGASGKRIREFIEPSPQAGGN
jgi:WD40 repeat protein